MHRSTLAIASAAYLAFAASVAPAQTYPEKSVRLIIPFTAGGGADIFARLIGRKLQDGLGQSFVADNRAGAAGIPDPSSLRVPQSLGTPCGGRADAVRRLVPQSGERAVRGGWSCVDLLPRTGFRARRTGLRHQEA